MSRNKNRNKKPAYRTPQELIEEQRRQSVVNKAIAQIKERKAVEESKPTPPCSVPDPASEIQDQQAVGSGMAPSVTRHALSPSKKKASDKDALLLTVVDLCQLLNLSRSTINRMERAGKLPGRIEVGGAVRYHRETIEGWLRDQVGMVL